MDPELASRPGFEGCRQVNGYGQVLYGDLAPVSFFQGMKTDSWQNYMHRRLDIGIFLSLDNDDEMDTIHFAGIKHHQTRASSSKIKNVSIIESNHVSPFKKEPALCLRQIKRARKWQPRAREKLERGRDAVSSCWLPFL